MTTAGAASCSMSVLLFALAALIAAKRILVGLDLNDSPYFISLVTHGDPSSVALFPGLAAVGRLWARLAGDGLMGFRLLFALVVAGNLSITYRTVLRAGGDRAHARLLLGVTAVIATAASPFVFGYDILSGLALVLIVHFSFRWYQDGRLSDAVVLGVLTLLATSFRVSNVVVVFPLLLLLGLAPRRPALRRKGVSLLAYATPVVGLLVAAAAGATLADVGIVRNVPRLIDAIGRTPQATYRSATLAAAYLRDAIGLILWTGVLSLGYGLAARLVPSQPVRRDLLIATLISPVGVVALLSSFTFAWNFRLLITASALCYAGLVVWRVDERGLRILVMILAALSLVPAAGSDTGLLKTSHLSVYLLPVFIALLDGQRRPVEAHDRARTALALSLIPAALILAVFWSYGDVRNPVSQRHTTGLVRLRGVHTTGSRAAYVRSVYESTSGVTAAAKVMVVGEPAHLFYYLFGQRPFDGRRWVETIDDEGLVDRIVGHSRDRDTATVVLYVPGSQYDPAWPETLETGAWSDAAFERFARRMVDAGFEARPARDHVVFVRDAERAP